MHPGVIECSPPKVIGNNFLSNIFELMSEIFLSAIFIFLSILNGFKVLIPIFYMVHNLIPHHTTLPGEMP